MSMNLHCDETELWQTPTWLSYVALYDADGKQRSVKETQHIYLSWVESTCNGRYELASQAREQRDLVNYHIEKVKDSKIKEFYIL